MARVQAGRGDLLQDRLAAGDHGTAAVVADGAGGCRLSACRLAVPNPCKTPPGVGITHGHPSESAPAVPTPSESGPEKGEPPPPPITTTPRRLARHKDANGRASP